MHSHTNHFDAEKAIENIRHYLPHQAALKDFVHHNTLHAFQDFPFHEGIWRASTIFGYKTYLSIQTFREFYHSGRIKPEVLQKTVKSYLSQNDESLKKNQKSVDFWINNLLNTSYNHDINSRLFQIRNCWKSDYKIKLSKIVNPLLFRILASYLDQGIAQWKFPARENTFLKSLRTLEQNGYVSLFKSKRSRMLFLDRSTCIQDLLKILVGDENHYEQYLFDQQFSHPGWSGFVSVVEFQPETLLDKRNISLKDLIFFELILEIDALDNKFREVWKPLLINYKGDDIQSLFSKSPSPEIKTVLQLWQDAYEWSYFDGVLSGIQQSRIQFENQEKSSFQGLFCIDDREYSLRRHLETVDDLAETYGTPGYFGVEFYFQPEHGKFVTKACPSSIDPEFIIKEVNRKKKIKTDPHFKSGSHSLIWGGLISGTLGFWSALKLFLNLFKPSLSPLSVNSFEHSDKHARLQIEATQEKQDGLAIGFTIEEMTDRVLNELKRIGLTKNFAPLVYIVGHGGSSVNNPYYAGYDCGACCGRPGAVNARVFSRMANKKEVRAKLKKHGLDIPDSTHFISAMHDTTKDEIEFYEEQLIPNEFEALHQNNISVFNKALELNAQERSFRFETVDSEMPIKKLHKKIKNRSVSLFEPRPEWNHTDNALCIVGRKNLFQNLHLDKRPFLNSYDFSQDLKGDLLETILSAAVPVCGGINLEYYFSRVDQQKLGAGTKLPHNVVGLFGLNTGVDGDLRTGLPSQMVEIHEPVRILFVIEHFPEIILDIIKSNSNLRQWIENEWILLVAIHPDTGVFYRYSQRHFKIYEPEDIDLKIFGSEINLREIITKKETALISN